MKTKVCTQCKTEKLLDQFGKEVKGKYGVNSKCKVCRILIRKDQYQHNKEHELTYGKQYRSNNEAKEKARCKRYRELNPEKVKESRERYIENNPEKVKERRKKWAQTNKDLVNKYSKNHKDVRREFLDLIKLEEGCQLCGYNEHPRALQFDHINPQDKEFTISALYTCAMSRLLSELDKCRVLCANCHSIHSWQEQHWKAKNKKSNPRVDITIKEYNDTTN